MAASVRRKNASLLTWVSATGLTAATFAGLTGMRFAPGWGAAALALVAGALALVAMDLGVLAALLALSLPLIAADPIAGILFIAIGVVAIRYLGADGGQVFLVVAAALAGAFLGPVWAAVALAGVVMGAGEGALAAAIACISLEALGILLGEPTVKATLTGGATAVLDFGRAPETLFATDWVKQSFGGLGATSVDRFVGAFAAARDLGSLAVQPVAWALGAGVAGMAAREARKRKSTVLTLAAAAVGVLIPAAGAMVAWQLAGRSTPMASISFAAVGSLVLALAGALIWERAFPLVAIKVAPSRSMGSMAAEDADVDELLSLIATAEERLATQHTTQKVVMITDMKSFSRMTEEDGSILTAKAIQKHRDLLLPIVEKYGGHGKSTGGDGLVAAFDTPKDGVAAAAEMQRKLDEHNTTHPNERDMWVRIGVAEGEVVLDKHGRPFIGAALNIAARVMNLADGGQAFASADVASRAGGVAPTSSHGEFELKNIAKPVEIVEILWHEGQEPVDPRTRLDG